MPANLNQVPASTQPYSAARLPYPLWNQLISVENLGFANYQGLQLEAKRRFRNGFSWQAGYTLSKNVGADGSAGRLVFPQEVIGGTLTDRYDTRYDRGDFSGARRHRVLFTGLFPLPFGRGRAIGSGWRGPIDRVLGGWELSTVTMVQSGPYLTPTVSVSSDQSNTNVAGRGVSARPDRIGNGNLPNPTAEQYFDRNAFALAPKGAGRFGNAGAGILQGPGTIAVAAGISKTFRVLERARLRAEVTFTNLPNHPNFLAPITALNSPLFGKLTTVQTSENSGNRTGQLGARIDF